MTESTHIHQLQPASTAQDALSELFREGARRMLVAALGVEVQEHIDRFRGVVDEDGKRRVVRTDTCPSARS